jgi:type I restriction enzyme S subunit
MQLLKHFKTLTTHPKNTAELKRLVVRLAINGKLTNNWRDCNNINKSGAELLADINLSYDSKKDKLSKRDKEEKIKVIEECSKEQIPSNWTWSALHDVATFWNGKAHEKGVQEDGEFILVNSRFVSTNGVRVKRSSIALSPLSVNDIAIVMSDVPDGRALARCFLVQEAGVYTLNQRIGGITIFEGIDPKYLMLVLDRNQHYLDINDGKKQSNLKRIQMISCPIPLPPLEEQKAIVKVVNQLFVEIEELEQQTKARIQLKQDYVTSALQQLANGETAKEWESIQAKFSTFFTEKTAVKKLRESILQLAVQGKLTKDWRSQNPMVESAAVLLEKIKTERKSLIEAKKIKDEKQIPSITDIEIPYSLPKSWVWCRMQDLCPNISSGSTPPKPFFTEKGVPYLKVYNIRNQKIDFAYREQFVDPDYHSTKLKRSILDPGDVIMNIVGPPLGKVAIIPDDFPEWNCNQAISFFKPLDRKLNTWLYTFLLAGTFLDRIELIGTAGQDNISVTKSKTIMLPLPPFEEQKAIVKKVNALMAMCDKLETEIEQNTTQVEQLMQSCLREVLEDKPKSRAEQDLENIRLSLAAEGDEEYK